MDIVDLTFSLDTSAYASGDVLADTQELPDAMGENGGQGSLESVVLLDEDDNTAAALDLVFLASNVPLGTENAAPSITDANARNILGIVSILAADWIDLGGSKIVSLQDIGMPVKPSPTSRSIYVAAITRGSPTHTASGLRGRFGFQRNG